MIGNRAALIRGPAGSGKTRLAFALIDAAATGRLRFVRLIADDRVELAAHHGRLVLRAPPLLAGLIEARGIGIQHTTYEPVGVAGLVIDLAAADAERMPASTAQTIQIHGVTLPRLPVADGTDALAMALARLRSDAG